MFLKIFSSRQSHAVSDWESAPPEMASRAEAKSSPAFVYRRARDLERAHRWEEAKTAYQTLIERHSNSTQAGWARRRLELMAGRGSWMDRLEHDMPVLMAEMVSPQSAVSMMTAGLGFRFTRLGLGSWLSHSNSWARIGGQLGVRGLSFLGALGSEGLIFSTSQRLSAAAWGQSVDWNASSWMMDCRHSWLSMGAMRLVGSATQGLYRAGHRVSAVTGQVERWRTLAPVSRALATEGGAVGGILLGSWLAAGASWEELGESPLLRSMMTHWQFKVTASWIHQVVPGLARLEHTLDQRFQSLAKGAWRDWIRSELSNRTSGLFSQPWNYASAQAAGVSIHGPAAAMPLQLEMRGQRASHDDVRATGLLPKVRPGFADNLLHTKLTERPRLFIESLSLWDKLGPAQKRNAQRAWVESYQQQVMLWRRWMKQNAPGALLPSALSRKQLFALLETFHKLWVTPAPEGFAKDRDFSFIFSCLSSREVLAFKNFLTTMFVVDGKGEPRGFKATVPWVTAGLTQMDARVWDYLNGPQVKDAQRSEALALLESEMFLLPMAQRREQFYRILSWAQGAQNPALARRAQGVVERCIRLLALEDLFGVVSTLSRDFILHCGQEDYFGGSSIHLGRSMARLLPWQQGEILKSVNKFSRDPDPRVRNNARLWLRQFSEFLESQGLKGQALWKQLDTAYRESRKLDLQPDYIYLAKMDRGLKALAKISQTTPRDAVASQVQDLWECLFKIRDPGLFHFGLAQAIPSLKLLSLEERINRVLPCLQEYFSGNSHRVTHGNHEPFVAMNRDWMRVLHYFPPAALGKIFRAVEQGLGDRWSVNESFIELWTRMQISQSVGELPPFMQYRLWGLQSRDRENSEMAAHHMAMDYVRLSPSEKIAFWRHLSRTSYPLVPHFFESFFSAFHSTQPDLVLTPGDVAWMKPVLSIAWRLLEKQAAEAKREANRIDSLASRHRSWAETSSKRRPVKKLQPKPGRSLETLNLKSLLKAAGAKDLNEGQLRKLHRLMQVLYQETNMGWPAPPREQLMRWRVELEEMMPDGAVPPPRYRLETPLWRVYKDPDPSS